MTQFFRRRALTKDEWVKFLSHIKQDHVYNLFVCYLKTGTRRDELLSLKKENVYKVGSRWRIRVLGKGKKWREIVLHRDVVDYVREMVSKTSGVVFPYPKRTVDQWFREAADKAGLGKDITLHSLRHTAATWALDSGAKIATVRDFLGHTNISTTNIYVDAQRRFEEPPEDLI